MVANSLLWIVGFISFAPLHLGLPLLVRLINRGKLPEGYSRWAALEMLWAAGGFVLAFGLSQFSLSGAVLLIVMLMPLPWVTIRKLN